MAFPPNHPSFGGLPYQPGPGLPNLPPPLLPPPPVPSIYLSLFLLLYFENDIYNDSICIIIKSNIM